MALTENTPTNIAINKEVTENVKIIQLDSPEILEQNNTIIIEDYVSHESASMGPEIKNVYSLVRLCKFDFF